MNNINQIQSTPQGATHEITQVAPQVPASNQFNKQIGKIVYEVSVNFKSDASETLDAKIIRIIKNELGSAS